MYIDTMDNSSLETVDLKYELLCDDKEEALYIKFHGFENEVQREQFAKYIVEHLPLLLYNSDIAH